MSQTPPFILIDASSYLFRAYHALPPLANSRGEPTGAIVGTVNMINKLIKDYQPQYIGVVFDDKGPTFRHKLYPEYKANRPPIPDDLLNQIEPLHQIIKAMGLPLIIAPDVEADDVIGTLAQQAEKMGWQTVISTGDKDLAQLVSQQTTLINTMNNQVLDIAGVVEKFKVQPEQIIDYLALMGDTADNIQGIPKCGKVTAAKWLNQYQSVDQLIQQADQIKGKIGENLRNNIKTLTLAKQLTTLKLDVHLNINPADLTIKEADKTKLKSHFQQIESKRLLATLEQKETIEIVTEYECILEKDQLQNWLKKIKEADYFAFDTETTSLDYMQAQVVGVSFAVEAGKAAYCPFAHTDLLADKQLDRTWVLEQLKPLLEDPTLLKVGQNLKYDKAVLLNHQIDLQGIKDDTMLQSYILNATASRHNMDALAKKYLQIQTTKFEDIAGKGKKQLTFDQIPLDIASNYAAEDADITLRLYQYFNPLLIAEKSLNTLYQELEIPLMPILMQMERTGIALNSTLLNQQSQSLAVKINALELQAYEVAGHKFNLNSPKQIGQIFFEELNYPIITKTAKGAPSTGEAVLQTLAEDNYPLAQIILEHRSLAKLKSTYTDKLPALINSKTGRLHTSYHQAVTATGRLSSSDPNLQNIPIRSAEGRQIRQAFIPQQGWIMLAADYSQIELRIMAHLSADKGLVDAFQNNQDIHRATAAEINQLDNLQQVTKEQRRAAKAVNFGLIYGMSAFGLSKQLGIERQAAQTMIDRYFERYPKVQDYMEETRVLARKQGYIETLYGRRLYLPDINSKNFQRRSGAERAAINAPMQGTAADIIKKSMLSVAAWLKTEKQTKMLLQVHDELVFEVHPDNLENSRQQIKQKMEQAVTLSVPLIVDIGTGQNWDEAH